MSEPPLVPERGNQATDSAGGPRITIAPIALGCGNFGGIGSAPEFFGQGLTEDQSLKLMDAAWQSGIRHFDTADAYGGGGRARGPRPPVPTGGVSAPSPTPNRPTQRGPGARPA